MTERNLASLRSTQRKVETRTKIELGGLVIKAGLSDELRSVILGALLSSAEALNGANGDQLREMFKQRGDAAFRT